MNLVQKLSKSKLIHKNHPKEESQLTFNKPTSSSNTHQLLHSFPISPLSEHDEMVIISEKNVTKAYNKFSFSFFF